MHGAELRHLNSRYSRPRVLLSNARNSKAVLFKSALRKLRARGLTTLRYVWQRLATLGYVWIRTDTFEYIWKRVDMFNYVWLHFGAVWQQFGNIWQHLTSNWIQLAMIWQQTWKTTPLCAPRCFGYLIHSCLLIPIDWSLGHCMYCLWIKRFARFKIFSLVIHDNQLRISANRFCCS